MLQMAMIGTQKAAHANANRVRHIQNNGTVTGLFRTVHSLCKDTRCKDNLNVRTAPLVTNQCILTAMVPLSKDNSM